MLEPIIFWIKFVGFFLRFPVRFHNDGHIQRLAGSIFRTSEIFHLIINLLEFF